MYPHRDRPMSQLCPNDFQLLRYPKRFIHKPKLWLAGLTRTWLKTLRHLGHASPKRYQM